MAGFTEPDQNSGGCVPSALGLGRSLEASGLNVAAPLARERYDAIVPRAWKCDALLPSARSVYVIGSGGADFHAAARRAHPKAEHPLDEFCETLVAEASDELERSGFATRAAYYWERRGESARGPGEFADFVALARAAGMGESSRLGMLLHPVFGPWFAIRALLLTTRELPAAGGAAISFDPCAACPAPCIDACPGGAVSRGAFSGERCAETRAKLPQCARRCDARLACPVGADHRYGAEALAYHMTSRFRAVEVDPRSRGASD